MAMLIHHNMTLTAISPSLQVPYVPDQQLLYMYLTMSGVKAMF
jgi:hypothetical protein